MGLLKSYESDECSSEEPVETLSEECLLGSDDCTLANFSFQLPNPPGSIKHKSRHVQGVNNVTLTIPISLNSHLFGIQTFYCVRNRVPYLNTKLSNKKTEL